MLEYATQYPDADSALFEWYHEMVNYDFKNFNELKKVYAHASIVSDDRVVFNISGNKYRLVVRINFRFKAIQIKWFGAHKQYEAIDVEKVIFKK